MGWDLVDSEKHLDWDHNTKYLSTVETSVKTWENYKKGIIRRDSVSVLQDVYISDYSKSDTTLGYTSSNGELMLNDYNFKGMTNDQRIHTITPELGHSLGLDHTWGSSDIMQ